MEQGMERVWELDWNSIAIGDSGANIHNDVAANILRTGISCAGGSVGLRP